MAVTSSVSDVVSFDQLRGFPKLFTTYCQEYSHVAEYYAADFKSSVERSRIADARASFSPVRDRLADVLLEQNRRWVLDSETRQNIETLRDPESIAVVTGQQIGLFGGPLYTVYKVITTLQLARRMAEETGRPSVPVFWMAAEDHDYDEISELHVIKRNATGNVRYREHDHPDGVPHGPTGRLTVGEEIASVLDELDAGLLDTEFKPELLERLQAAYAPGTTLEDAFARLLKELVPDGGLVMISPDDRRLKQLSAPLWEREITEHGTSETLLREVSSDLEETYHAQIYPRATNLFMIEPDGRFALEPREDDDGFYLRGLERTFSTDELLQIVEDAPERISPNVALRPLMQDYLLPTAAYVAGPSETSYFAQLRPLYEWMDVPMPVIYPRVSATLVESKIQKVLDRYDLALPDLQDDLGALFEQVIVKYGDADVDVEYDDAVRDIHQAINRLKPVAEEVDQTLASSAEATRAALVKEIARLKEKIIRAEKRNHDEIRNRLQKAQVGLFPDRQLQERYLSVLYFMNKYSPAVVDDWIEQFSLDTTAHQVHYLG